MQDWRLDLRVAWQRFALLGAVAACVYMLGPGTAKAVALVTMNIGAGLMILLGIRLNRPSDALPWKLAGSGLVVFGLGNVIWTIVNELWNHPSEVVPIAHVFFFGGYVLVGAGMLVMLRDRVPGGFGSVLLDGLIMFSGFSVLCWVLLVQPLAAVEGASLTEQLLGAAYPMGDLFMLGALSALLLARGGGSPTGRLFVAAIAMNFVADIGYLWVTLRGEYALGVVTDLGWFAAYTMLAIAALHPSMRTMTDPVEAPSQLSLRRLLAFVAAAAVLPLGVVTEGITNLHVDLGAALVGSSIIMALVIARMVVLVRQGDRNIAKLQAAETRFRNLVEQIPAVAYIDAGDETSTNVYMSPRVEELTGYSAEEWMGRAMWFDIMHPDDVERAEAEHLRSNRTGKFTCEYRLFGKDGRTIWIRDEARRVSLEDGTVIWQGILQDLTTEKNAEVARLDLEERLRQVRKMEAVGELAGGVAHDFNNLLAVIQNYTRFVQDDLADERLKRDLDEVINASERGAALVKQLLAFARKEVVAPEVLDLNELAVELLPLLEGTAPEDVEFKLDLASEPMLVEMGRGQIDQILMNLVTNGVEAIGKSEGQVIVETYSRRVDGTEDLDLTPGNYSCLRVSDSGRGMTPEVLERIFEPFFTTKERASGTGLGLATVYGIAKRVRGAVEVESIERAGSSFTVYIPAVESESSLAAPRSEPVEDAVPRAAGARIVVAEDESPIARLLHRVLSDAGHDVEVFVDPRAALEHLTVGRAKPDVLLADVLMPNMSGRELAEAVRRMHPTIQVIYMSGYTADIVAEHGIVGDGERYLQKPFKAEQLLEEIESALKAAEVRA